MGSFEILEHTADVGVRATGTTLEEVFEQAARGMCEIAGIWRSEQGKQVDIEVEADDLGGLLVDWLSEILYLHDARSAAVSGIEVHAAGEGRAAGTLSLAPLEEGLSEGVQVKAVTYHQLRVEPTADGWTADVYLDI
jgi:SHS2 domain-containing protein